MIDKDSLPLDKPRRTPGHPTKSHVVKTRVDGKEKIIRFGEQGASTAGKPKEGESEAMKQKRASFKARHAKNIAKGKSSPAYWANKTKWATGGSVELEDLDEKYEGIKKPDFSLLESFRQLISDLQARAEDSGTQEFDPVRALGRSGAAGSLEDLYEAYSDKPAPHASKAEAGAKDPKRTETAKMVFDSFKNAGFSDAQAKALTAEINREGSFNPAYLYGSHTDAANKATNVGMLSWQGDRANRLMSFMADRGLIDPAGRIAPGQDALNAQAEYLRWEMENDPSYTRTRETFLANPDIDQETAHDILGKNFIRWRIDDPKYRGSGFERISEGYDLLNMAQGYAEGGLAELAHKYDKGGKKKDDDELERAKMERQLAEQMQGLYEEDLSARGNVPRARSEPQDPRLLNVGGLEERLALLNQTFNPVEAIGGAMRAGRDLMDPEAGGYDRLAALGNMLSGVAGVAGPAAVAKRIGAPAATAVMESLLGASPTAEALADMGRKYAVDESGALRLYQGSPHDFAAERLVRMPDGSTQYIVGSPNLLPDVPTGAEVLRDFPLGRQRMDKIGTGEGAQAYGYGLYGAENEAIARSYRDALAGTALPSGDPVSNAWDMIHRVGGNDPQMRNMIRESFVDMMEDADPKTAEFARQSVEAIDSGAVDAFKAPGHMYELEVNANPEDFLDWDRLLSEQPEVARRIGYSDAARIAADRKKLYGQFSAPESLEFEDLFGPLSAQEKAAAEQLSAMPEPWNQMTGKDAWFRASKRRYVVEGPDGRLGPGADTYEEAVRVAGGDPNKVRTLSDPAAPARAEFMREAGVPGIRYLDAGSRNIGDGSRNYVIFDENLINIVRKYGIAGAAAMLGVSAADVEQAMAQGNVENLDQKYAEGGKINADNPYDILNLEPDAFVGALDELGMQGEERKFLMDQYFAKSRALPMTDRPEGKTVRTILPIATPEGMSGYEALMSGDFEFAVPEILRGIYEAPAEAINVASAIGRGVPVTETQVQEAGMVVPEFMAGVVPVRAITINGGRLGALDYDPTVTRVFAGPKADTANKDALARAKRMKAEGLSKDDIWNKTGWFQLGDGQWRFEIDDRDVGLRRPGEGMKMAEGMRQEAKDINKFLEQRREDLKTQPDLFPETIRKDNAMLLREKERLRREAASNYGPEWDPATVGQRATYAITDSELQRAYPSLMRETIVRINQNLGGPYGWYEEDLGNIKLAPEAYIRQAKNPLQQDPRGTLIHELQHAIQGYEGFSRGTNTTQAKELLKNLRDERIKTERDKFSEMFVSADPRLQEIIKNYEGARHMGLIEPLIDLELEAFQMPGGKELIEQSNRILAEVEGVITPDDAFKAYESHLGELEARLAQGRRDWTPQQRRTTPPWAMPEYIPDEEQIRSFIAGPTRPKDIQGLESKYAEGGAIGASQYDPDAIETTASRVRENKFAAGGAVKYDPAAVDGIINKLREVNRG